MISLSLFFKLRHVRRHFACSAIACDVLAPAVKKFPNALAGLATNAPHYPKGAVKELEGSIRSRRPCVITCGTSASSIFVLAR